MSLFSALGSSAGTIYTIEQALNVTQNNISNASTPGYVEQTPTLEALPGDVSEGLTGGVTQGETVSARDQFAEQNVRSENSGLGTFEQQVESLTALQNNFDISGNTGIPAAFNQLFSAFSGWSNSPNDPSAQAAVLQGAQGAASAFQQTAAAVSQAASDTTNQIQSLVGQINNYATQISQDNAKIQAGGKNDPAIDADVNTALENLSEIAGVSTLRQSDGTVTVLLGGQTTLVSGSQSYAIGADISVPRTPAPTNPAGPPGATIVDANGNDISTSVTGGKLYGALNVLNDVLPAIQGNGSQPGALNILAKSFADRVNGLLTAGDSSSGPPAQPGVPLFTYDSSNPTNAAASLAADPSVTGPQLAAIDPGPPVVSNGTALNLAALASPTDPASEIGGQSYTQYFGSIAANVGSALSTAQNGQTLQTSLVAQARSMRQQTSGVSLDQEAATVLQLQQSYDAASKVLTVVDEMLQSTMDLIK
jgi:flagellar hook-associated protein 1 FlgK